MRRGMLLLQSLALVLALAGCGSSTGASGRAAGQPTGVNDVIDAGISKENSTDKEINNDVTTEYTGNISDTESSEPEPAAGSGAAYDAEDIDIDLTALSSTMVYSEVYNMMSSPQDYIGKVVKMAGAFAVYHDEAADVYYFACIIKDATACCAQGIEFVLDGDYVYPEDYPALQEEICVTGIFDTYQEGEYTYCTLRKAELL